MRITAELIDKSSSFINAVRDRELDLRGERHWTGAADIVGARE